MAETETKLRPMRAVVLACLKVNTDTGVVDCALRDFRVQPEVEEQLASQFDRHVDKLVAAGRIRLLDGDKYELITRPRKAPLRAEDRKLLETVRDAGGTHAVNTLDKKRVTRLWTAELIDVDRKRIPHVVSLTPAGEAAIGG